MTNEELRLGDIVNRESLQQMQNSIARATNISTVIMDSSGIPITEMTNSRGICKLMGDTGYPDGSACMKTREKLFLKAREAREVAFATCPFSGMTSIAVPIILDDTFLGVWVIGHIRFSGDSSEYFEKAAHKAGLDAVTTQELLAEIPVITHSEFKKIVDFVTIITVEIVKLAASNIEINNKNKQLTELTENIKNSMETLRAFADTPDVCIYITDFYTGEVIMCNNNYAGYFNKSADELVGTYCYENLGYNSRCAFCPVEKLTDENENPLQPYTWENYLEIFGIHLQITSRAVHWPDGRLVVMSVTTDITQRKKMEDRLYNLAFFDQMLQIPNYERMEQDMREGCCYNYLIAVRLTDISRINTVFGRACGDALLKAVRDYILGLDIPNGTLYRGKVADFGILLKDIKCNYEIYCGIAEEIHERCKKNWEVFIDDQRISLFISANICVLPMEGQHDGFLDYLYSAVEHSFEIARKTDGVVIYDDDIRESYYAGLQLELSLKNAVRENMRGFHAAYQPIVDVEAAMWGGVEVLCRWDSPEFGSVAPGVFIPVAETNGLINTIGLWILEQSIIQIKAWGLDHIDRFLLEVNLSPIQLNVPNLDKTIMDVVKKHDYPPEKLGLEITESSELNFSKHTMEAIERLNELGVVIVLDDFGTGYSSFNTLHMLPVDILKTDRAFISGIESDKHLQHLLSVMVYLAHNSDMKLVAEGVESDSQVRFLLDQGADFFQGYYFSQPLTAEQLLEKMDNFYYPIETLTPVQCVNHNTRD